MTELSNGIDEIFSMLPGVENSGDRKEFRQPSNESVTTFFNTTNPR